MCVMLEKQRRLGVEFSQIFSAKPLKIGSYLLSILWIPSIKKMLLPLNTADLFIVYMVNVRVILKLKTVDPRGRNPEKRPKWSVELHVNALKFFLNYPIGHNDKI